MKRYSAFIIVVLLFLAALASFFIAVFLTGKSDLHAPFSSLLLNLSASLLILILATFLIDPILEGIKEKNWRGTRSKAALDDFKLFSNMVATYLLSPLGIKVYDYMDINNADVNEEATVGIDKMLKDVSQEKIEKLLQNLSFEGWKHLTTDVLLIRNEIQETLLAYNSVMPKDLLSELLTLRVKFKAIDTNVGLLNSTILYSRTDWEERNGKRKRLYLDFCRDISKCLIEYLSSGSRFRTLLASGKYTM